MTRAHLYLSVILTSLAIVQARYLARAALYSGVPSLPNLLRRSSAGKRTAALEGSISRKSSSSINNCMMGWCRAAVKNTCGLNTFGTTLHHTATSSYINYYTPVHDTYFNFSFARNYTVLTRPSPWPGVKSQHKCGRSG